MIEFTKQEWRKAYIENIRVKPDVPLKVLDLLRHSTEFRLNGDGSLTVIIDPEVGQAGGELIRKLMAETRPDFPTFMEVGFEWADSDTFKLLTLDDILSNPLKVEWLVEPFIPIPAVAVFYGDSGVGKSWLAMSLAMSVASGEDWLGRFPVKQGSVMVCDEEQAPPLMYERLSLLERGYAFGRTLPLYYLRDSGVNLTPLKTRNGGLLASESFLKLIDTALVIRPALIVLDSYSRFHTSNENASNEMASVHRSLKRLSRETGASLLILHHTPKNPKGNISGLLRGSGDIRAHADETFYIERADGGGNVLHDKSRWSKETLPPFSFELKDAERNGKRGLTLAYNGKVNTSDLLKIWLWLEDVLAKSPASRKVLVHLAKDQKVCSTRKLDGVLQWRFTNGFLDKRRDGREVVYYLKDEVEVLVGELAS